MIDAPESTVSERLARYQDKLGDLNTLNVEGRLVRMIGLTLEAVGVNVPVGTRCKISTQDGHYEKAEVVGFSGNSVYLMPAGEIHGLSPGARVIPTSETATFQISEQLLGRVI
ncbi:MAG: flagellum-specific ATP synthase FliI, partial [Gammaproteobacteria bacterium]|nr:flagellum-specific ATP synthase FliI [Gammaproteobacteria bacterium]NNJ72115.1 flagellum-specific ATP synthase FliI [Enterobacterales bacterium]